MIGSEGGTREERETVKQVIGIVGWEGMGQGLG